jgi:hypothetical protein
MGTIELQLTQFRRFGFVHYKRKLKVGFCFWNEAILQTSRRVKIKLDDFFKWAETNQTIYFSEMLYSAYVVWCKEKYQVPELDKKQLLRGFADLSESEQKEILNVWQESESFGVKDLGNKKKVTK